MKNSVHPSTQNSTYYHTPGNQSTLSNVSIKYPENQLNQSQYDQNNESSIENSSYLHYNTNGLLLNVPGTSQSLE